MNTSFNMVAAPVQAVKQQTSGVQRLMQPLDKMAVGFGFKSSRYKELGVVTLKSGAHMDHFGADWWQQGGASRELLAMGNGTVLLAGEMDTTFGNIVVVRYNQCLNHRTGEVRDLIVRCYHLERLNCTRGQTVRAGTVLGRIGTTGLYSTGVHVHIEADTAVGDPFGVPGIAGTQYLHWVSVKSGTISDPAAWTHTSVGRGQSVVSAGTYYRDPGRNEDFVLPTV